jgi:hypothetical protein
MIDPAETDKLSLAKTAIVEALNQIEYDDEAISLRGIRHVQFEPRWGEPQDAAAAASEFPVRACSGTGLV